MPADAHDPRLGGLPDLIGARRIIVAGPGWPHALGDGRPAARCSPEALPREAREAWDLVGLLGVLATVEDPSGLLDAAVARLAPGGLLVLAERTVPGAAELTAPPAHRWPPFRRWQLGSVLQGYGLGQLGFSPLDLPGGPSVMRVWGWRG
jgi:SAM-dependent methyltransferase